MTDIAFLAVPQGLLLAGPPRSNPAGDSHHSHSLFPPPPGTFQGAMRTAILQASGAPLEDLSPAGKSRIAALVGKPESLLPGWQLDGPWIAEIGTDGRGNDLASPWLPAPACISVRGEGHHLPLTRILPFFPRESKPMNGLRMDRDAPQDLAPGAWEGGGDTCWLSAPSLLELLSGRAIDEKPHPLPPCVKRETAVGLKLDDDNRTAVTSMLYFREGHRFGSRTSARAGLAAWLTVPASSSIPSNALTSGTMRLGAKGRVLTLEPLGAREEAWDQLREGRHLRDAPGTSFPDTTHAWLVLASPVCLTNPERHGTPVSPRLDVPTSCSITVRSAILHKPKVLGGLQVGGMPKPNRASLPPGSAWLLRLTGGTPETRRQALLELHHRCTLGPEEDRSFGMGRTWIALLPPPSKESP